MDFGQKKFFREIDFTSFLVWTILNFLAHCVIPLTLIFLFIVSSSESSEEESNPLDVWLKSAQGSLAAPELGAGGCLE